MTIIPEAAHRRVHAFHVIEDVGIAGAHDDRRSFGDRGCKQVRRQKERRILRGPLARLEIRHGDLTRAADIREADHRHRIVRQATDETIGTREDDLERFAFDIDLVDLGIVRGVEDENRILCRVDDEAETAVGRDPHRAEPGFQRDRCAHLAGRRIQHEDFTGFAIRHIGSFRQGRISERNRHALHLEVFGFLQLADIDEADRAIVAVADERKAVVRRDNQFVVSLAGFDVGFDFLLFRIQHRYARLGTGRADPRIASVRLNDDPGRALADLHGLTEAEGVEVDEAHRVDG